MTAQQAHDWALEILMRESGPDTLEDYDDEGSLGHDAAVLAGELLEAQARQAEADTGTCTERKGIPVTPPTDFSVGWECGCMTCADRLKIVARLLRAEKGQVCGAKAEGYHVSRASLQRKGGGGGR